MRVEDRRSGAPQEAGWRLDARALLAVRAAWLAIAVGLVALVAVGFVRAFRDPELVALAPLTDLFVAAGLDFRLMIAVALLTPFVTVVAICAVVFARRSHDPMALLFTLTLLAFYGFGSRTLMTYDGVLGHAISVVFGMAMVGFGLVLALFPDGRFVPRSARWLAPAMLALLVAFPDAGTLLTALLEGEVQVAGRPRALLVLWSAVLGAGLLAQAHRYRRVSGPTERQQAKWVVAPLGLSILTITLAIAARAGLPESSDRWVGGLLVLVVPLGILVPVMVANAVLRYRLYEIDRIVSRTIAYGLVVAALGAVYGAGVLGLGAAVSAVTGERSTDLVVAASVLAAAALVRPLHRRVQTAVDRRFHRTGYEARLVVEAYARRLRRSEDLAAMRRDLAAAAAAAVKPSHVSLWLADRQPGASGD